MADALKARAADIKRRADEHHAALKEKNRALWDMIEAARKKPSSAPPSGAAGSGEPLELHGSTSGGRRKSTKLRKHRKNRKNRTYKK